MEQHDSLKERELEILQLMAEGLSDAEIAEQLFLAKDTVRWYNKQIYSKLNVHNRTEAVTRAREFGLFEANKQTEADVPISKSPIQYVKNDGLHIAYQVIGQGEIDLLVIPGFVSHIEHYWEEPEFKSFIQGLASAHRLILFDKRGMGLSDRTESYITLEDMMSDACAVMDALGSEQVLLMGISEGGAAAILFAATYPERLRGLILYGTTAKFYRSDDDSKWAIPPEVFKTWLDTLKDGWGGPVGIELFAPSRADDSNFRNWWSKFLRMAASPGSLMDVFYIYSEIDVRHVLTTIRTATLVLHRSGDIAIRIASGRYIAEHIPNARLVELSGLDHFFWIDGDEILKHIVSFSRSLKQYEQPEYILATVLNACFDNAVSEDTIKSVVQRFRGRIIKQSKDSLTATFDGPSRAIRCAKNLSSSHPHAKFGLHTGECRLQGDSITGTALDIAEQICEQAQEESILVSRTIRDLIAGSGIQLLISTVILN